MSAVLDTSEGVLFQGWVLKKRRKKLQGFGRRYFLLYQSGILAYAFQPGQPLRDQISLTQAVISTAPGRKDIHVDSNTATFHLKCLSTEDFDNWMSAFRKFKVPGFDKRRSTSMWTPRYESNLNKSGGTLEEMALTLIQLEEAVLALLRENSQEEQHNTNNTNQTKCEREKYKEKPFKEGTSVFGLFKKSSHSHGIQGFGNTDPATLKFQNALNLLKAQHAALSKSWQTFPYPDGNQTQHSPLPITTEEEETLEPSSCFSTAITRTPRRTSIATSGSDFSEWFDASDSIGSGAQEFVLNDPMLPNTEPTSHILDNDSKSSLGHSSTNTDSDHQNTATFEGIVDEKDKAQQVLRRIRLPASPVGDEGSLFAMLKKNVGKDLSTIAFPVTFNEPLTLLQRIAEEMEYFNVLDQAARTSNPVERLSYIAAFVVSSYAHTRHRSGRKGFNPMLAETFEDIRINFIAEKVRHQPLVVAYHAEGSGWELDATSAGRTKFWGKSLEIIPLGTTHLKIGEDHFEWKKPSSFMRNLMIGTKYLEHCGKLIVENKTTKAYCVLDFKQGGYWASPNTVSGTIHSASREVVGNLEGKWDEQFTQMLDSSHFRVLWRITAFPKNAHDYYGFTSFGITLNEITSDLEGKLPPTDSRFRPDVRALEQGDLDMAEKEKIRVEEMQRQRRKHGQDRQPRWFKQVGEDWIYAGGYWESRARGWKDIQIEPLW